jgi:hypothetical protein
MRRLESQADGRRRFAVDVLKQLRAAGPERCRANLPAPFTLQADALINALVEIKERATVDACAGFGQVLTDLVGTRAADTMPELYEAMERGGQLPAIQAKAAGQCWTPACGPGDAKGGDRRDRVAGGTGTGCPPRQPTP